MTWIHLTTFLGLRVVWPQRLFTSLTAPQSRHTFFVLIANKCKTKWRGGKHRVITTVQYKEPQRLVVLCSLELFTMVGQLRNVRMIRKRGGIISYLYRQNKGRGKRAIGRIRTYYLQHGTVYTIQYNQRNNRVLYSVQANISWVSWKILQRFEPVGCCANHTATETFDLKDVRTIIWKNEVEWNKKFTSVVSGLEI